MERNKVLDQLLGELETFLKVLDRENLSSEATVQKSLLSDLLQSYLKGNGVNSPCDEEYIYMNKVTVSGPSRDKVNFPDSMINGQAAKQISVPQKSLPELPQARLCSLPVPDVTEGYYEEAQPYDTATNEDGEAVSSSYESYDEEEVVKGRSAAQHQWPSPEASIELMKDARICAFLWRKRWLGQWAKQLCVIREHRLLCYKSSKEQSPQLEVSLLGCSVVYKEKQVKKKEHKLKVLPVGGEAIVLGLQSKEQAEEWLKVIQEISGKPQEGTEVLQQLSDSPRLMCTKGELGERHSVASESGSSTDSHAETTDSKDVKWRYGAALKLSNLMNIGKKKTSSVESSEKPIDTSGYLNVLMNSQWRARWCLIKNGQLWFYQDKSKSKMTRQPVVLEGCVVLPDPSPDHLYSFRIEQGGEQLAILEAKSSADMGHWLGLLLSQSSSKTSPEDLTYDYVDSDRISSIVNAAKTSMYLMQRRISEPNTYTDNLPTYADDADDLYDNVANTETESEEAHENQENREVQEDPSLQESHAEGTRPQPEEENEKEEEEEEEEDTASRVYLDLIPVRSFLHAATGPKSPQKSESQVVRPPTPEPRPPHTLLTPSQTASPTPQLPPRPELDLSMSSSWPIPQQPKSTAPSQEPPRRGLPGSLSPQPVKSTKACPDGLDRPRVAAPAEIKLGRNRTEADVRRFTDERDRLEREKEQVRSRLATLRGQRKELKEALAASPEPTLEARLKETEEACRLEERKRVDLELQLVEVKENLKKVEAGPFTLGTAVDSGFLDLASTAAMVKSTSVSNTPQPTPAPASNGDSTPVNSASSLKNRPSSIVASSKGNVLQKAKEWEKKSAA